MRISTSRSIAFVLGIALVVGTSGFLLQAEPPQEVGTWASIGTTDPQATRTGAAVATLPDRTTLVAGGLTVEGAATDSVVIHDPLTNSSTAVGQLLAPRVNAAATRFDDGRILITGGQVGSLISSDIEIFDPATGESTFASLLQQPRTGHASALLADGTVLIVGGTTVDGVVLATTERFDPSTNSVSAAEPMAVARTGASATTLIDGRVLVAGGHDGAQDLTSAELYSPFDGEFLSVPTQMSKARSGHSAVLLPHNNSVLITGGTSGDSAVTTTDLFLPTMFPDPYSWGMGTFGPTDPEALARMTMVQPRSRAVAGPWGDDGYAFAMGGGSGDGEVYRFATIKTDKDDYAPGELAVITGSGWQPLEEVTLTFQEDPAVHDDYVLTLTADDEGNIFYNEWAPEEHDLNVRFYLMATGVESQRRAQITFTDARTFTATINPATATQGLATIYTLTITNTSAGSPLGPIGSVCVTTPSGMTINGTPTVTASDPGPIDRTSGWTATSVGAFRSAGGSGAGDFDIDPTTGQIVISFSATATSSGAKTWTTRAFAGNSSTCNGTEFGFTGAEPVVTVAAAAADATTTSVVSSMNPSIYGNGVVFTATVARATGSGTPTGSVQFKIDSVNFGAPVTLGAPTTSTSATAVSGSISTLTAGTHTVEAVYVPTGSFTTSADLLDGGQVVNKATPTATLTVSNSPQTYTGSGLAALVNISANSVPGAVANILTGGAATQTVAGNYAVTADFVPTDTANYHSLLSLAAGTFVIDKATATVVVNPYDVPYDGNPHTATVASITGVNGETGATVGTVDVSNTTHTDAGTYASDTWSFTGTANYNDIAPTTITDQIDKATAMVVVNPYDVPYDGNPHTATVASITGVNGETGATVGTVDVNNTTHTDAGTYASDTWSFTGTANYNDIAPTTITDQIDKATATVVVNPYDVPYDGNPHTATVASITGVNGETGATVGTVDVSNTTHTDAGTYASDTWSFTGTANYNDIAPTTITDQIDKATATVVVNPYDVPYDGNPHTATVASITGVNGETGATVGTVDVSNTTHTNAGTYASDSWSFTGTANYNDIDPTPITNEIDQADANVSITPYSGTYDAAAHNLMGSVTGVAGDPTAVGSSLTFGTSYTDAGNHTGTWTFEGGTNYVDESGTAAITISQADANVSITPYSGTYDAAAHNLSGTVTGVAGDLAAAGSSLTFGTSYTDAGNHTGTWTFEGGTNYVDESGTAAITISQADANVSITPYSGTYDAAAHNLTGSVTGVAGDPTAVGSSLTFGAGFTNVPGGTGTWNFEGGTNYLDESGTAAIVISKANATVTVTPYNVQWDGDPHTATYLINGVGGQTGAIVGTVNVSNTTHTLVGTYASDYWFFTGTSNYNNIGNTTITDVITTGYCFNGFLSPIGGAVENVPSNGGSYADPVRAFKLGSTIPVKFILNAKSGSTCGAVVTTGVHTLQATYYSSVVDSDPPVDASPTDAATTGNQFRLTGTEWHFNLSTKGGGFKAGTWLLKATLEDGSVKTVWVTIKK